MTWFEPHAEGWVLSVRAQAGARRNEVRGLHEGALKLSVTQVAEKGKANLALRDLLAKSLALKKSQVELIAGQTSPHKRFLIRELSHDQLQDRLRKLLSLGPNPQQFD